MALDIHRPDTDEFIFSLNDERYNCLSVIFEWFEKPTGIYIDPYGDTILDVKCLSFLAKLIDGYVHKTDLNLDKKRTSAILEFRGVLNIFIEKNVPLKFYGD